VRIAPAPLRARLNERDIELHYRGRDKWKKCQGLGNCTNVVKGDCTVRPRSARTASRSSAGRVVSARSVISATIVICPSCGQRVDEPIQRRLLKAPGLRTARIRRVAMFKRIVDAALRQAESSSSNRPSSFACWNATSGATSRWGHRASASTATVAIVARSMMGERPVGDVGAEGVRRTLRECDRSLARIGDPAQVRTH